MIPSPFGRGRRLVRFFALATMIGVGAFSVDSMAYPEFVEGTSMESALHPGQIILLQRLNPSVVARGDIVVFHPPTANATGLFIKRVIALAGETVSIHGGEVFIDGRHLAEPYLPKGTFTKVSTADYSVYVPRGSMFVLGDHRVNSWDSRGFGPVPLANIVGRVWATIPVTATAPGLVPGLGGP